MLHNVYITMTTTHDSLHDINPDQDPNNGQHTPETVFATDQTGTTERVLVPDVVSVHDGQPVGHIATQPVITWGEQPPATETTPAPANRRSHGKMVRIGALVAGVATMIGIGAEILSGGSDSHKAEAHSTPVATSTANPGQHSPSAHESASKSASASASEIAPGIHMTKYGAVNAEGKYVGFDRSADEWNVLQYQPTLMTANDPKQLFEQFKNNYLGLYQDGATPYGQLILKAHQNTISALQELYTTYLGGHIDNQALINVNNGVLNAAAHDTASLEYVAGAEGDGTITIEANFHSTYQEPDGPVQSRTEDTTYTFVRTTAGEAQISGVDPSTQIWVLQQAPSS